MAKITWTGKAQAVAQVDTVVVGGTWATNDIAWIRVNGKTITFTVGATQTVAAVVAGLVAAWNASQVTEVTEITAADANPNVTLTANTAGVPFTVTVGKTSTSGTISVSTTTTNAGPNVAGSVGNYSSGALPADGDTLVFEYSAVSVLYDLEALDDLTSLHLIVRQSYTGDIGLPATNAAGYPEYRPTYFKAGCTTIELGEGEGNGSKRIKLDNATVTATVTIYNSGNVYETGIPAILLKGTGSNSTIDIVKGTLGVGFFSGETATVSQLDIGYLTSQAGDVSVVIGDDVTLGTIHQTGGKVYCPVNLTALVQDAGEATIDGTATVAAMSIGGTVYDCSSGAKYAVEILSTGKYDHRRSMTATTIHGAVLLADRGEFHDPYGQCTFPDGIVCNPQKSVLDCGLKVLTGSGA